MPMRGRAKRWFVEPKAPSDGPALFPSIEAFQDTLAGIDGAGPGARRRATIAQLIPGEAKMAVEIIELALELAGEPDDTRARREARTWLLDRGDCIYSAKLAIEALGGDYVAIRAYLLARWSMQDVIDRTLSGATSSLEG